MAGCGGLCCDLRDRERLHTQRLFGTEGCQVVCCVNKEDTGEGCSLWVRAEPCHGGPGDRLLGLVVGDEIDDIF